LSDSEDAEVIRRAWPAISRRDIQAWLAEIDPDIEAVPLGADLEGRSYRGHDGIVDWLENEIYAVYDTFEVHPEEIRAVGGGRFLVFGRWIARGRESGVNLDIAASWVIDIRNGKIVRWQTYTDRERAIRDAGLKQPG
jgi:ketosteroid isomerase-like protein